MTDIETIPGQLETIVTRQLAPVLQRLSEGDVRMNEGDKIRAEMNVKIDGLGKKVDAHDLKLDAIIASQAESAKAMAENTAVTKLVNNAITTAKGGRTFLIWVAGVAGALATIVGTVYTTIQAIGHR